VSNDDMIQVVMEGTVRQWVETSLRARGLRLFRIPIEDPDDLPTYGIAPVERPGWRSAELPVTRRSERPQSDVRE
jgi:hypothetical protein